MKSFEIRSRFLGFFIKRGHAVIPSAPLVTSDDLTATNPTLFNTAGMQPLIPYLLGKPHPLGKRLVDVQRCIRTIDIEDVGDRTHATFFEMMGNWSLGGPPEGYFKEDAIKWSYEFLTSKEEGLGLEPQRLYITVFTGDDNAKRDDESAKIWESVGVPKHRIYFKGAESNWWPAVKGKDDWTGPTGPCSEMFYDVTKEGLGDLSPEEFERADKDENVVEIWNDVFMEFEKKEGVIAGKLAQNNVDTGAGFERLVMVMQGVDNIYDTDLFVDNIRLAGSLSTSAIGQRIIADHLRAAVFLIAEGLVPSNTDRGYVLRRLIRRAVLNATDMDLSVESIGKSVSATLKTYDDVYPDFKEKERTISGVISEEVDKFARALDQGRREFDKISENSATVSGSDAFHLFSSYGLPIDMTLELARIKGKGVDVAGFEGAFRKHQEISRAGAKQKFKGGLADPNDAMVLRYHTATHLLHQALRDVLGKEVEQKGSNITPERLRFDFSFTRKMTVGEKKAVEDVINAKIAESLPMNNVILPRAEAEKTGALHFFGEKYGDQVSVYFIGKDLQSAYSKEFCGGPHVKNTSELAGPEGRWRFKIVKEEAVSQGVRRIKATLN